MNAVAATAALALSRPACRRAIAAFARFCSLGHGFFKSIATRDLQLSVLKSRTHIGIQHTKPLLEQYRGYHVHKCQLCLLSQQPQP